jgi:PKD repeat protein
MNLRPVLATALALVFLLPPAGVFAANAPAATPTTSNELSADIGKYLEQTPGGLFKLAGDGVGPEPAGVGQRIMHGLSQRVDAYLQGIDPSTLGPLDDLLAGPQAETATEANTQDITGAPVTYTGTVYVDGNWFVHTDITFNGATVIFNSTRQSHFSISVDSGKSVTITNSVIRQRDGDRAAYSFILSRGVTTITGSTISEIRIQTLGSGFASTHVADSRFSNAIAGIANTQNGLFERNLFTMDYLGFYSVTGSPTVQDNTFEMNEIALETDDPGPGTYQRNVIVANEIGILCFNLGGARPQFLSNNVHSNYGDALMGTTFDAANTPLFGIDDSQCDYDGNYLGGAGDDADSVYLSAGDTNTNVQTSPNSLPSAPALPWPLRIISTTVNWNSGSPPPALTGPVVVKNGGHLTISGITMNSGGFTIGSKNKGNLDMSNVNINGRTTLYQRSTEDTFVNVELRDLTLFEGMTSHRNNGVMDNVRVLNAGPSAVGFQLFTGLVGDDAWTPDVKNSYAALGADGVLAFFNSPTVEDSTLTKNSVAGLEAIAATLTLERNHMTQNFAGLGGGFFAAFQLNTVTSSDSFYEGGVSGFFSAALNTLTFTNDVFANNVLGFLTQLDTNPTCTSCLITHNLLGFGSVAGTAAMVNSNAIDNYGIGLYTIDVMIQPPAPGVGVINCTNCFKPDDESVEGTVAGTFAVTPNAVPLPSWWGSRQSLAAGTVDLGGVLSGPVIVRKGAKMRIVDSALDLNGFNIGAKGVAALANVDTGKIEIRRSDLSNGGALLMNSTDVVIELSTFRWTSGGADIMAANMNMPTIECNAFYGPAFQTIWTFKGVPGNPLTFRRNLVVGVTDMRIGFDRRIPGWKEDAEIHNNGFVDVFNAVRRGGIGGFNASGNNFLTTNVGFRDNGFANGDLPDPVRPDVSNNYWFHHTGPLVLTVSDRNVATGTIYNGLGAQLRTQNNEGTGYATWQPYATSPFSQTPCVDFKFAPARPLQNEDTVLFTDRSFDPSGFGITSRTWDFGDGSPTFTTSDPTASHLYTSFGIKHVTLTTQTQLGASSSVTKDVRIYARPVPSFTSSPSSPTEIQTITFSDTSTDPDGTIASRSWSFSDGFTSTAQNPTHRFADGGTKSVTLSVVDNDGFGNSVTQSVSVANVAPSAAFSFDVTGLSVAFTDQSTHPNAPNDHVVSWSWDFGDSGTSTSQNPTHSYSAQQVFTVSLTVTDDDGLTSTVSHDVDLSNVAPTADFSVTPNVPAAGHPATFHDESTDSDGSVVSWVWDFGDSTPGSTEQDPSHTYLVGGEYTVTLTAGDDSGATSTVSKVVHVCETHVILDVPSHIEVEFCQYVSLQELLDTLPV